MARHNWQVPTGVRRARTPDVDDIAALQVRSWRANFANIVPAAELAALDEDELAMTWASAILNPPTPTHQLMVAVEDILGTDVLVGYAAFGAGTDPDANPETAELLALVVDPGHTRLGHGSRLLAATVEQVRASGHRTLVTWLPLDDEITRGFLSSGGWGPDSAYRDRVISDDKILREVRLVTDISVNSGD